VNCTFGLESLPATVPESVALCPGFSFRGTGWISKFWSCITTAILLMPFFTRITATP